ncbi:class I SAM-dependent methyltransferase [Methanobacterium sp. ACI-7]|uniref:class I SAM-dependent methyltransferase n=1 Tax=unclassified Methanobacterium TaxID=2627676 RepID=UPI0039C18876
MYSYFEIQSKVGITKHMGSLKATKELIELCNIKASDSVLIVGSGNGKSALKIHQLTGCRIVGIDISEGMVKSAEEKAKEGLQFMVGNAENIPCPDNTFDVVISESVTAFTDKNKSIQEYYRVLKKGGYLGLNEVTWLQEPSARMEDYVKRVMGLEAENENHWMSLITQAGFKDVINKIYSMKQGKQFLGELREQNIGAFKMWGRFIYYYLKDSEYRKSINYFVRQARKLPSDFDESFGYGLYVGQK